MSQKERVKVLGEFTQPRLTNPINGLTQRIMSTINRMVSPDILFVQIRSGSAGLNLQAFNQVHLISPDWNPCNEIQAIARAHRLGQTSEVTVYKYILNDPIISTIDMKILARQEEKLQLTTEYLDNSYETMLQSGSGSSINFDELLL